MSRMTQKTLALAAAAAVATAAPLAIAQETTPAPSQVAPGVNPNADVSLTIDKRLGEVGSTTPLEGSSFRVERVQMNNPLTTAAGWQEASEIAAAGAANAPVTGDEVTKQTGQDGRAVFDELTVGLYRVTELQNGNYTVAAPFLVTLPLLENGTLNYTPTISPKNQLLEPTKSAEDTNVTVGEDIVYTIHAPVPAGDVLRDGTRTINQFRIEDTLQAELTYNAIQPARVTVTGGPDGATLEPAHYTVTWDDAANTLTVNFTAEGRQQLATWRATHPGLAVEVEFNATVTQIPANGRVSNTAQVYIPNAEDPLDTTPATEDDGQGSEVITQYVNVAVSKTVNGENVDGEATGAGAVFNVYECTSQDNGGYVVAEGAQPLVGTNQEGTAPASADLEAAGGSAAAPAVAAGYALQFDPEKQYCAVETTPPSGYLLNPDPTPLNLNPAPTPEGQRPLYTATVNNVRDTIIGRLPATGERTMIILLALGLVLFVAGAAYQLRRKNN
ncbi:SpaH/EbpB family LPXTG-anchored major pilin [Corynebacterium timonense]|uniref:LPXTG-motif cell wall anchor domain-containing protein/fimbrial isopeptide formation D2 domain-containing protein n=1 Tax=Corynebacterium timonense TaxID=441500 RepID=A0A1H1L4Q5_9CORY|nr:SpaH/EbpB family LPXTG-anchored major pilin [Corynebacterium timonense]SDR68889.1 LPXTG-motif cell wall anchor domain-containing protein/fimbrial isopeptide formation D2 domain-containing protein [Corynebacterium timonense]